MAGDNQNRSQANPPASPTITLFYTTMIGAFAPIIAVSFLEKFGSFIGLPLDLLSFSEPSPAVPIIVVIGAVLGFASGITRVRREKTTPTK